jgi:hypothetical protein
MADPLLTFDRHSARKWREAEFLACFLMGLGFGMLAETRTELDAFVAVLICAASLALMVSARQLREMIGDLT